MKFINLIIAVATAIPIVNSWIEKIFGLWATYQIGKIKGPMLEISKQRKALMNSISKASNDEERAVLSVVLYKLDNNKL